MLTLYSRSFDSFQVKNVQYPGTGLIIWFGIRLVSCKARIVIHPSQEHLKILPISRDAPACYNITIHRNTEQ